MGFLLSRGPQASPRFPSETFLLVNSCESEGRGEKIKITAAGAGLK